MTHIHVNKELTDDLESQGYHLVDKHQLARMQALEKVARSALQVFDCGIEYGARPWRYATVDPDKIDELRKTLEVAGLWPR